MQITKNNINPTNVELHIAADKAQLEDAKTAVLKSIAKDVEVPGFRKGHAPQALIERSANPNTLQSQFLDQVVNDTYLAAVTQENLRPVAQPEVTITKFVPFDTLELTIRVEVVGEIKLPDYKKIKLAKKTVTTTDQEVTSVLDDLRNRNGTKTEVQRAAKEGDEVTIDFAGDDTQTGEAIAGATGTDYPLVIGSNTFIPGFEPELVGLKPGAEKTFNVTFPKDYGTPELQNKKVSFTVKVKTVWEVVLPKLDDAFAAKVGPLTSVAELKADIKKQLQAEKENQARRSFENELLSNISEKAQADIPKSLVDEEIDRMEAEEKRNLIYRGQTWQEHLKQEGKTEAQHREDQREQATIRVKTGLVLGEIAEAEKINVSAAELDERLEGLKKEHSDPQMQAELNKPENRREIASRLLTEKTIDRLVGYCQK